MEKSLLLEKSLLARSLPARSLLARKVNGRQVLEIQLEVHGQATWIDGSIESTRVQVPHHLITPTRNPAETFIFCKLCERQLPGQNFYERHLQCTHCQMAVNSITRSSKVAHAQAKQAYMEALQEAAPEVQQDLEAHRQALANDAAHRLVLRHARLQDPNASGSAPAMREVGRPAKRAATRNASLDQGTPPRKRSRASPVVSLPAGQLVADDKAWACLGEERPCHRMLMLLQACQQDMELLDAANA
jgi:hypothetical protein